VGPFSELVLRRALRRRLQIQVPHLRAEVVKGVSVA
jgi:hypothetical protein